MSIVAVFSAGSLLYGIYSSYSTFSVWVKKFIHWIKYSAKIGHEIQQVTRTKIFIMILLFMKIYPEIFVDIMMMQ